MSTTATPTAPNRWRRHRGTLLIAAGLVLAVAVVVIFGPGARTSDPLDPDNPAPSGARALAQVLGDQGVEVTVARGAAELASVDVGPGATVLVVNPEDLGRGALADLVDRFDRSRLVIAGAGPGATAALGSDDLPGRVGVAEGRAADCADPLLSGLEVRVDDAYAYPGSGPGDCFGGRYGSLVVEARPGVTLLGADQALTNDQILRGDNAAVALRLLGQQQDLVWFVPSLSDLGGADGVSLQTLLPRWIQPAIGIGLLVVLSMMLWRGRRLGALATEPLPVAVKAIETTHSLGRLYRRAGDRPHAAATLRRAAVRRSAARLQLGRRAGAEEVVRAVARHLDRREDDVRALLSLDSPAPTTDPGLIALASELAELDREVRRP